MKIIIQRSGQVYGPYNELLVEQYLASGKLLPNDLAREEGSPGSPWQPLHQLLPINSTGSGVNVLQKAVQDVKSFDPRLFFPWTEIASLNWTRDRKLINLAVIGLAPATALAIADNPVVAYWAIAFYFSAIWAVFLYYLFRTPEVRVRTCFICFFFTGLIAIPVLLLTAEIPPFSTLLDWAGDQNIVLRMFGMFLGVGLREELCKAAILFWLVSRSGPVPPQVIVFYGMISGLGFGIYEGVSYQQHVNREQGVDAAYFLNVARLTSLPFLHAIWSAIAGYFIGFSSIVPGKRHGLWVMAIVIPAFLHANYNVFGWSLIGLGTGLLSVILLMTYLSNCHRMQSHLTTP